MERRPGNAPEAASVVGRCGVVGKVHRGGNVFHGFSGGIALYDLQVSLAQAGSYFLYKTFQQWIFFQYFTCFFLVFQGVFTYHRLCIFVLFVAHLCLIKHNKDWPYEVGYE